MERIDLDLTFDNDASSSSFGWNFQANAGIYLFLHYIKDALSIKIESKRQDIVIERKEGKNILAQAKSVQDLDNGYDKNKKFKDAILSLAKTGIDSEELLIYITNIPSPILNDEPYFKNKLINYSDSRKNIKNQIDKNIKSTISFIDKVIKDNGKNKNKLIVIKERLENFPMHSFSIMSIYPYEIAEERRYNTIKDKVLSLLVNDIKIDHNIAICIQEKLFEHWQLVFEHNSTIPDKENKIHTIKKSDIAWSIVASISDFRLDNIVLNNQSNCIDEALKNRAERIISQSESIYHERFEFMNSVLRKYNEYKKTYINGETKKVEIDFINTYWPEYKNEFLTYGDELIELLTKAYMYRILLNNWNLKNVSNGIGL